MCVFGIDLTLKWLVVTKGHIQSNKLAAFGWRFVLLFVTTWDERIKVSKIQQKSNKIEQM